MIDRNVARAASAVSTASARFCAAVVAVGATLAVGGAAHADPGASGKDVVVLGDSYAAHGNTLEALLTGQLDQCFQGDDAWPAQLRTLAGLDGTDRLGNYACPGAAIDSTEHQTLTTEARKADAEGAFGPDTRLVAIQLGVNDDWDAPGGKGNAFQLCGLDPMCDTSGLDMSGVTGDIYAQKIAKAITYIKYYAPNAHVVLAGYPELGPAGSQRLCLNTLGLPVAQDNGRPLLEFFERLDQAQRDAAATLGLDFVDTRALTAAHDLCSPEPWVNGMLDPQTEFTGWPYHPDAAGDHALAADLHDTYLNG